MLITSTISADLRAPGFPPLVYAVQGEQYSRQITMHLYDGGLPWTVPGGVYIAMRYSKPDGTKGYYDTLPDGSQAWSVSGSTVNVFVAPQMLTVPGFVTAQLEIIQNQSILASFSLRLKVEANPAAALTQSEDYVNWLKWMEDQLKEALKDAAASGEFTGPAPTLEVNTTQYQAGTSPQTPPSGKWLDNVPSVPQGQYLWTKHTSKWNNSSPVTEYSVAYQGQDGADTQLETDTVDYQIGTSGDTPPSGQWSGTIPAPQPGKYFWTRRTKKWNTGTAKVDYSVAYAGTNGTPATVQTQKLEYQVGADGKNPPSGAWSPEIPTVPQGQYLWMRYTVQFNTGSPTVIQMPTYQGINGKGAVASVAGISPDSQGNVPLTADNVGALATTGGEMSGPIQMNGQPVTGLNDPEGETDAARKGYVDAVARRRLGANLYDNNDFKFPVNQRMKSIYNNSTGSAVMDRWNVYTAEGVDFTLSIKGGYIEFSATGSALLVQRILKNFVDKTKTYTNVVKYLDNPNPSVTKAEITNESDNFIEFASVSMPTGGRVKVEWVDLFDGEYTADTVPAHYIPQYPDMLGICRWYFERIGTSYSEGLGNSVYIPPNSTAAIFTLPIAQKRIDTPTCIASTASNYRIIMMDKNSAIVISATPVTKIDIVGATKEQIYVRTEFARQDGDFIGRLQRSDGATAAWIDVSAEL